MLNQIRLLLFDIGNVILYFDNHRISSRIAEQCGLDESIVYEYVIKTYVEKGFDLGNVSGKNYLESLTSHFNLELDYEKLENIFCDIFDPNESMIKLVQALKSKYPLGILSNTNELHFAYVQSKFPIVDIFDHYILSYREGVKKPDKKVYEKVLSKTGFQPEQIFFVDDLERNIEPAKSLGFHTHQFTNCEVLIKDLRKLGIQTP